MTMERDDRPAQIGVVHLIDGPYLQAGDHRMQIPEGSARLVVLLAIRRRRCDRRRLAALLWPDCDDLRAAGNLRSAVWRLRRSDLDLIEGDRMSIALRREVSVDTAEVDSWAARLIGGRCFDDDLDPDRLPIAALDLLPGWDDDWVAAERARLRQRVLHAADAMSVELAGRGRIADAVQAAIMSITADPLRETSRTALIRAYLAEGNRAQAHREFSGYRSLLRDELGVEPSQEFTAVLWPPTAPSRVRSRTA